MNGAPGLLLSLRGFCGGFGGRDPTHDGETVMNGAPSVAEVAGGAAAGGDEELGAFEVDVIAGEAMSDVAVGFLDGSVRVEVLDEEHVVLDDGGDLVGTVGVTHVLVVHGHGAAAGSVLLVVVHALVRLGRFALEVFVVVGHDFFLGNLVFCCRDCG